MRHLLTTTAVVAWTAVVAGCTEDLQNLGGVGGGSSVGGVTVAGAGVGGAGGVGGTLGPAACTAVPVDHSGACPEPCAITVDVEMFCQYDDLDSFGARGVRVAPASEATWLTTGGYDDHSLFRVETSGATQEGELPPILAGKPLFLALSPGGGLELVADSSLMVDAPKLLIHAALKDDGWHTSELPDTAGAVSPPLGFEIAPDGTRHVWASAKDPDAHHLTRDGSGAWTVQETFPRRRVTLTNDEKQAELWLADLEGGKNQLYTRIDGVEAELGTLVNNPGYFYRGFAVPHPLPSPVSGMPLLALIWGPEHLKLAWPEGDFFQEITIPGTPALEEAYCESLGAPPCGTGTCELSMVGVDEGAFGVARTADGVVWVAYAMTSKTRKLHEEESCDDIPGVCQCLWIQDEEVASGTLHLVVVSPFFGSPEEVLSIPIKAVLPGGYQDDWFESPIDLRAFGGDLAIGLLTRRKSDHAVLASARLIRVDTTAL